MRPGAIDDPADKVWLWLSENMPFMKLICEPLLALPSSNMFCTLGSGLGDRFRRFAIKTMKMSAIMAATPPTEPTTTPAIVPPARPESSSSSSLDKLGVGVEVGFEPPTVTVFISPPALVSTATVCPVVVDVPEVVLVELSDFVCKKSQYNAKDQIEDMFPCLSQNQPRLQEWRKVRAPRITCSRVQTINDCSDRLGWLSLEEGRISARVAG